MEVSVEHHTTATAPLETVNVVPTGYEAVWAPKLVWTLWRRETLPPCRYSNPGRPARRYTDRAIATDVTTHTRTQEKDVKWFRVALCARQTESLLACERSN
jgi:hypothetical protein